MFASTPTVRTLGVLASRTPVFLRSTGFRLYPNPLASTTIPIYRCASVLTTNRTAYTQKISSHQSEAAGYQPWQTYGKHHFSTTSIPKTTRFGLFASAVVAAMGGLGLMLYWQREYTHAGEKRSIEAAGIAVHDIANVMETEPERGASSDAQRAPGTAIPGLPVYSEDEVSDHNDKNKGLWCTYKDAVYDITEFVDHHPGGDRILMAAGGALEPFWEVFEIHKTSLVFEQLEKYRIGNLSQQGRSKPEVDSNDPFRNDPIRHPAIIPSAKKPFNGEPPSDILIEKYITPRDLFYIRNHLPVPDVDMKEFSLIIESQDGHKTIELSYDDLKKFKEYTITATLQCAGNRRSDMARYKKVKGLNWKQSAIGNANFTGVRLRDVLLHAGIKENDPSVKHIQFEGLDTDPFTSEQYGASIPVKKAMDPEGDVLLAYKMNGEKLSRDHGYPLRVIVPGYVGARNVKWLTRIIASDEESQSHWQQNDYKGFSPSVTLETADYSQETAIQEYPVQSAICVPVDGTKVPAGNKEINLRGYAWSGGGRGILRVDVSIDGGQTWHRADLHQEPQPYSRNWAWTLWDINIPIPENHKGPLDLVCKAVDSAYNVQPNSFDGHWNFRGVLANAWSHAKVIIE
ncbi:sulfite oxidase-like [Ptychodera flava]|uniref:sulfite oxidase-like n=1 Tax=Ptychodera flava TaxID=63121 RepID=UPI00396A3679